MSTWALVARACGVMPQTAAQYSAVLHSLSTDPPTRYRIDYWLGLLCGMVYQALGGRGELPTPPWVKRESETQAQDSTSLITSLTAIGGKTT